MFLTPTMLPVWVALISAITFCILRANDPVDLSQYRGKVYNLPPPLVCFFPLLPLCVWICYEIILKLGPKGSKAAIKVYD
ncbi:hypothetical protein LSM04_007516 [Trypanosoma melophagium]|uniref:uncharacterized protein n=1 Tax=Trypanosoma melophagium TaxID=715481 RepID=UPI00351A9775|nr:hypothetical protein LSM04_007516 [Trypanosoma melophagium]